MKESQINLLWLEKQMIAAHIQRMNFSFTELPGRACLLISGEDAASFLQGLITQDIRKLSAASLLYAALLTPQGKYLHDFLLSETEQSGIRLESDAGSADELQQRLMRYRLRAKVTIEMQPQINVFASWGDALPGVCLSDPRPGMGGRMYGPCAEVESALLKQGGTPASPESYHYHRISLGIPEGVPDFISDKTLMLEAGMDRLQAVDFQKGCYVGQEVTARSKFRAELRKKTLLPA